MAGIVPKREKYFLYNTLVILVEALEGKYTTIDLRNESYVYGKITEADAYMNVLMTDVIFVDGRGGEHSFDTFFVQARNIRYVHIPDELSIIPTIRNQLQNKRREPERKTPTFRDKRLMQQQEETLELIRQMKDRTGQT